MRLAFVKLIRQLQINPHRDRKQQTRECNDLTTDKIRIFSLLLAFYCLFAFILQIKRQHKNRNCNESCTKCRRSGLLSAFYILCQKAKRKIIINPKKCMNIFLRRTFLEQWNPCAHVRNDDRPFSLKDHMPQWFVIMMLSESVTKSFCTSFFQLFYFSLFIAQAQFQREM